MDTNVLVHATRGDSGFRGVCREFIDRLIDDSSPKYLTWGVSCEFVRVVTHPRVYEVPWDYQSALSFIDSLIATGNFFMLSETERHFEVLSTTMENMPEMRGSIMYDLHTAVLMQAHGIREICTRDADFYRFPFLTVIDPLHQ